MVQNLPISKINMTFAKLVVFYPFSVACKA